ncbi:MAG: sigma-70 family RNA polymerase sigma factor [Planctomycetes bacterium]|nr:sigma-70 family RNA polymerase sigma factor [Planctomycetota bacterium]
MSSAKPASGSTDLGRAEARAQDRELIERALAGDSTAFEEIYERHRHAVYKVAFGMTRNAEDALDVVQETFLKAHKSLARFERRAALRTWLCQIAVHQGIDLGRRKKVRRADPLEDGLVASEERGPRADARERELKTALREALDKLSEKHRTVFVLYTVKGLSYKEIAEAVGCSVGTVMSRLFYARKNLQGLLAQFAR